MLILEAHCSVLLLPVGPVLGHCCNFQFSSAAAAAAAAEGSVPAFAPGCFSGAGTVTVSQLSCSSMLRPLTVKYWQQSGSNQSTHAFRLRPILSTLNVFSLPPVGFVSAVTSVPPCICPRYCLELISSPPATAVGVAASTSATVVTT